MYDGEQFSLLPLDQECEHTFEPATVNNNVGSSLGISEALGKTLCPLASKYLRNMSLNSLPEYNYEHSFKFNKKINPPLCQSGTRFFRDHPAILRA